MNLSDLRSPIRVASFGVIGALSVVLGGCMGSPTYGTDKTANAQLLEDLSGALSLGIGDRNRNDIEYQPRPDLVEPQTTAVLPPPQDDVTTSTAAGWPESPEQRLARVRREATEYQDNPAAYRSGVINDVGADGVTRTPGEQQAEFRRRLAVNQQGSAVDRRYLSEPPLEFRVPAASAPVGELGETEAKKERDAKKEAREASREARKNRRNNPIGEPTSF